MNKEFTIMGIPGPHGERRNNRLREMWINGKSRDQLTRDLAMLLERKNYNETVMAIPRHYCDKGARFDSQTALETINFWIKEIELELSK